MKLRLVVGAAVVAVALLGSASLSPANADSTVSVTVTAVTSAGQVAANTTLSCSGCSTVVTDGNGRATIYGFEIGVPTTITARFNTVAGAAYMYDPTPTTVSFTPTSASANRTIVLANLHLITGTFTGANAGQVSDIIAFPTRPANTTSTPNNFVEGIVVGNHFSIVDPTAPYIDQAPFYYEVLAGNVTRYSGGGVRPQDAVGVSTTALTIDVPGPSSSVSGRLVDAKGNALPGHTVQVGSFSMSTPVSVVTDAAGGFTASALWKGRYYVTVPGMRKLSPDVRVIVQSGSTASFGTIAVGPLKSTSPTGRPLVVTVSDPYLWYRAEAKGMNATELKLLKKSVIVHVTDAFGNDVSYATTCSLCESSTASGKAVGVLAKKKTVTFSKLPVGAYTITLDGTSTSRTVRVSATKTTRASLTRPKTVGTVSVAIKNPNGTPARNENVVFFGKGSLVVATDSHGRATSPSLVAGTYRVGDLAYFVQSPTGALSVHGLGRQATVTLKAPKNAAKKTAKKPTTPTTVLKKIAITLPAPVTVSGTVVDATGAPIVGVFVYVAPTAESAEQCSSGASFQGLTDATGNFTITVPEGTGSYFLSWCEGYTLDDVVAPVAATPITITRNVTGLVLTES